MEPVPDFFYRQSGAIPYRVRDGGLEILVITSRSRRRWIIPKGVVEPELSPADSAAQEAYEEAGVRGRVGAAIGAYQVEKWNGVCTVTVFPMEVTEVLDAWPEAAVRERRWVDLEEACRLVKRPDLEALLRRLPGTFED